MLRAMVSLAHLIGVAAAIFFVWMGVVDLCLVGLAIWNYGHKISIAAFLFMAGFGALLLYLGVRIFLGIRGSFRAFCRHWQAERDRADAGLPRARVVSR